MLVAEVLTLNSSRVGPLQKYDIERTRGLNKQYLRKWVTNDGLKGKPGVKMREEKVRQIGRRRACGSV